MAEVKLPIEAEEIAEPEASEPQLGEPIEEEHKPDIPEIINILPLEQLHSFIVSSE